MEDIELLVYILLIAFGLFSRLLKGKKNKKPVSKPASESTQEKKPASVTFEELLREFTGEAREKAAPQPSEQVKPIPEPAEEVYEYDDEFAQRKYQESLKQAEDYQSKSQAPIDDRHTGKFSHFRGYEEHEKEEEESEYIKMLREEDGPRKAIILSEILNRKY